MTQIYTKTGDQGNTQLREGQRLNKSSLVFEVLGEIDELNCHLGRVQAMIDGFVQHWRQLNQGLSQAVQGQTQAFARQQKVVAGLQHLAVRLAEQQPHLMQTSAILSLKHYPADQLQPFIDYTQQLERQIDHWQSRLPELHHFLLPGGHVLSAELMLTRAVCRRVERRLVKLVRVRGRGLTSQAAAQVTPAPLLAYFNRLSDWLFVISRHVNQLMGSTEQIWRGNQTNAAQFQTDSQTV